MDKAEKRLSDILYRHDCPSKLELGEYDLGLLELFRHNEINMHLASCPLCQTDVAEMRQFMTLPETETKAVRGREEEKLSLLEQIKVVVVDLLSPPAGLEMPAPLQPAMRGDAEDMFTRVFHVDSYIVALSSIKDPASQPKQHLIGDILPATDSEEDFRNWNVYLWSAGKLLATSAVDQDSHFSFDDIQAGKSLHDLILSGPNIEIHLQNLRMV